MYIETGPNRNSRPAILLREGGRQGKKVYPSPTSRTGLPRKRRALKDETLVSPDEAFSVERSLPHGHVELILEAIADRPG